MGILLKGLATVFLIFFNYYDILGLRLHEISYGTAISAIYLL
jgi:hypothetical protein